MKEAGCRTCMRTLTRHIVNSLQRPEFPKAENLSVALHKAFEGFSTRNISPIWMSTFWVWHDTPTKFPDQESNAVSRHLGRIQPNTEIPFQTSTEVRNMNKPFLFWRTAAISFSYLTASRTKTHTRKEKGVKWVGRHNTTTRWKETVMLMCRREHKLTCTYFKREIKHLEAWTHCQIDKTRQLYQ